MMPIQFSKWDNIYFAVQTTVYLYMAHSIYMSFCLFTKHQDCGHICNLMPGLQTTLIWFLPSNTKRNTYWAVVFIWPSDIYLWSVFTLCTVCYLQVEPRSGEWIHCFNSPVILACNALRLMGAQLRLRLTLYTLQCAHIWARDRGSPRKWRNHAKREYGSL